MKTTKLVPITTVLSAVTLLTPGLTLGWEVGGINFGVQPRIEGGFMYYEYEQSAVAVSQPSSITEFGSNFSQEKLKLKDYLPTLSGGLTFFVDRFFVDFSAQRAFNGSDKDKSTFSSFIEGSANPEDQNPNIYINSALDYDADFDRDDYAISLGYSITDQLAVYAGYKWSKADFKVKTSGPVDYLATPSFISIVGENDFIDNLDGTTSSRFDYDVEYDGPFVGLTYGLNVDQSYLKGNFSFNFAVAFLDGKTKQKVKNESVTITSIDGIDVPPFTVDFEGAQFKTKGDTIGLTFGLNWRGTTPIEGLSYSLGVSAYSYEFDANNSEDPDFSETTIGFKAGVAYSF